MLCGLSGAPHEFAYVNNFVALNRTLMRPQNYTIECAICKTSTSKYVGCTYTASTTFKKVSLFTVLRRPCIEYHLELLAISLCTNHI